MSDLGPELGMPPEPAAVGGDFPFWSYEDLFLLISAIVPSWLVGWFLLSRLGAASTSVKTLIFQTVVIGLLLFVLYLLVAWRYQRPFWRSMGWFWPVPGWWWCLAAGPVLAFSIAALGVVLR